MSSNLGLDVDRYELELLGPAGYIVGLHIRFTSPLIVLENYPVEWTQHYTAQAYALRDPVIAWALGNTGVTRWSDIDLPDPLNVLGQAAKHGIKYGITVSVGEVTSRTIGSMSRSDREYTDAEMTQAQDLINKLHAKTEPPANLTAAQIEALRLISQGSRHAAVAAQLGISGSALKARLTAALTKLMAKSTEEAIQKAKVFKLL